MARLPLLGGSYSARSIIANSQRCVNLFPEHNPKDAPVPVTHYQRPGFTPLVTAPVAAPVRQVYRASNDQGYAVVGQNIYSVSPTWQLKLLGQLVVPGTTPVSMIDNGATLVVVDGSPLGYTIDLGTGNFTQINDPTGTFAGADKVDTIDTFILWNMPGTPNFGSTLSNVIGFSALNFGSKSNYPDPLQTLLVVRHEILLLGRLKTEAWYDAGNPQFPFAEIPGAFFEHGTSAKYSPASADISAFFLGQDLQGQGFVFEISGYQIKRISNHALEVALRRMAKPPGTISDAIGYTYQQDGHLFYVLNFPSGDATWVYDKATGEWHQRAWTDPATGQLHRDRSNCHAFLWGQNVVGDWQNGTLYSLDLDNYTDVVNQLAGPVDFIRTFPHITGGEDPEGRPVLADGKVIEFKRFAADIELAQAPLDVFGKPAGVALRWSDDRGRTFGEAVLQTSGTPGQYLTQPQWRGIGRARDRVFEVSYSIAGPAALNGAWVDGTVLVN